MAHEDISSMLLFVESSDLEPRGMKLYSVAGQVLFPIYGITAALTARSMSWIIIDGNPPLAAGVVFDYRAQITLQEVREKILAAIEHMVPFNPDGGDLPMPKEISSANA